MISMIYIWVFGLSFFFPAYPSMSQAKTPSAEPLATEKQRRPLTRKDRYVSHFLARQKQTESCCQPSAGKIAGSSQSQAASDDEEPCYQERFKCSWLGKGWVQSQRAGYHGPNAHGCQLVQGLMHFLSLYVLRVNFMLLWAVYQCI